MAPLRDGPPGSDEGIGELLRSMPRAEPPPVTLETVLDRWRRRRLHAVVGGAMAVAACLMALAFAPSPPAEAPVHLQIRVIEASSEAEPGEAQSALPVVAAIVRAPEELQAP